MASLYDLGEGVWLRVTFQNPVTGDDEDPSGVTFRYLSPEATSATVELYGGGNVIRESAGHFAILLTADEVGWWQYQWEGTNMAPAIQPGSFIVRRSSL